MFKGWTIRKYIIMDLFFVVILVPLGLLDFHLATGFFGKFAGGLCWASAAMNAYMIYSWIEFAYTFNKPWSFVVS